MIASYDHQAAIDKVLARAVANGSIEDSAGINRAITAFQALLAAQGAIGRAGSRSDSSAIAIAEHIADCIAGLTAIPGDWADLRVVDVGSGYGLPGMVAALARPNVQRVTLVEPSARRAAFLKRAAIETGARAEVIAEPAPSAYQHLGAQSSIGAADVVLARALAPPNEVISLVRPLLGEGATFLYWFGRREASRVAELETVCDQAELTIEMFRPEMLESRGWIAIIRKCG